MSRNKTYTVSEINSYIKRLLEDDFVLDNVRIEGEVSNFKRHSSGHLYFTLKDRGSAISVVMFASSAGALCFEPENGMKLEVIGKIAVYERDGRYQLYAREILNTGYGRLYAEFERLKAELYELGMFDAGYKRPIPKFAESVGIVTSDTGAAIQDIIRVSRSRNPYVRLYLCPAQVQGEGAALSIASALGILDAMNLDVIIVGRGGGSIEDLWAFNERIVAEAIFACNTPIVSAVGHETDFTIADFVADAREATPSSAAARTVFDYSAFISMLNNAKGSFDKLLQGKLDSMRLKLSAFNDRLQRLNPSSKVDNNRIYLDSCHDRLYDLMCKKTERLKSELERRELLLSSAINRRIESARSKVKMCENSLRLLSPYDKLSRGYSFVTNQKGQPVRSISDVKQGELLSVALADGNIQSEVKEITWKK